MFHMLIGSYFTFSRSKPDSHLLLHNHGIVGDSFCGMLHQFFECRKQKLCCKGLRGLCPVSYTHLDVYKRQLLQVAFTPRVGLEPTTLRLTAECSTIELSRIIILDIYIPSKLHTDSLDVYKRQRQLRERVNAIGGFQQRFASQSLQQTPQRVESLQSLQQTHH